jgi:RND family efflux transporter MFP subunit
MPTTLSRVGLLTALCVGIIASTDCGRSDGDRAAAASPAPLSVRVVAATAVERAEPIDAGGVVTASRTAAVSSRVAAPVTDVTVRAGDRVRAGDVLVRLDARDMAARVQQAGAATRAAEESLTAARSAQAAAAAEQKLAAAWHARISQLRDRNAATAQEFDEADARLAAASARTTAAQAIIEQASAQLAAVRANADVIGITESYTVIRAPFDGEVTERFTDPGNLASPGQPLLQLDGVGQRRVEARVDEARVALIRTGAKVTVVLDETTGAALEGTVVEVARAVAADQRAFTVKVALPAGITPRTGTFARVRFEGARRRALVVPAEAVRIQGQLRSVFVVTGDIARIRLVHTGDSTSDGIEIVAGLDAGEMVVVGPPADLTDGRRVTTRESTTTGARP